jgi:hypothetical protein
MRLTDLKGTTQQHAGRPASNGLLVEALTRDNGPSLDRLWVQTSPAVRPADTPAALARGA